MATEQQGTGQQQGQGQPAGGLDALAAKVNEILGRLPRGSDGGGDGEGGDGGRPVPYHRFQEVNTKARAATEALTGIQAEIERLRAAHAAEVSGVKKQLADYATSAEMRRVEDVGLARSGLDEVGIQTMRSAWEREPKATRGESPVKWWEGQVAIAKEHAADPKKPAPALHPTVAVLLPKFEPPKDAGKGNGRDPLPKTPERRQGGGELVRGQGRAALEKSLRQG